MSCKNCGSNILEDQNYCSQCGAKIIKLRLETFTLLKDWVGTVFNVDNKFIATFRHLFSQPASVLVGYIEGLRNKYMTPINYLLLAVGVFGFYLLVSKSSGYFHEEFLIGFFTVVNNQEELSQEKLELLKLLSFPLLFFQIPLYALVSKWLYGSTYNFAEYLIISTYWVSHLTFISAIISGVFYWIDSIDKDKTLFLMIGIIFIYTFYIHRVIFKQSLFKQIFKFIAFILLTLLLLVTYLMIGGYFILG